MLVIVATSQLPYRVEGRLDYSLVTNAHNRASPNTRCRGKDINVTPHVCAKDIPSPGKTKAKLHP